MLDGEPSSVRSPQCNTTSHSGYEGNMESWVSEIIRNLTDSVDEVVRCRFVDGEGDREHELLRLPSWVPILVQDS